MWLSDRCLENGDPRKCEADSTCNREDRDDDGRDVGVWFCLTHGRFLDGLAMPLAQLSRPKLHAAHTIE